MPKIMRSQRAANRRNGSGPTGRRGCAGEKRFIGLSCEKERRTGMESEQYTNSLCVVYIVSFHEGLH